MEKLKNGKQNKKRIKVENDFYPKKVTLSWLNVNDQNIGVNCKCHK